MFGIGMQELVIILILALIIFGPGKLPDVGKAVGKSIREFKTASKEITDGVSGKDDEDKETEKKDDEKKA